VAAWQLLRRGVAVDYVFCNLGGETHRLGALRVAKVLADHWHYGEHPQLHAVDFAPVVAELRARTARRYWQVLLKRQMLAVAERIALERGAPAIATGESVGQVSSQTLQNLAVISRATSHMVLRPLVGTNKEEIIRQAEQIGTFELSKVVKEYCDLAQGRPATGATLEAIEAEERRLDPALRDRILAGRRVFELRRLDAASLELTELACSRIPDGATVIDLRTRREYDAWHHEGALRLDLSHALQAFPSFDRRRVYVLYCDFGLMSAHLAERMRKEGFEAFHFRGGTAALRRLSPAR
jgi:thiamine biosynthesis protein ThiI